MNHQVKLKNKISELNNETINFVNELKEILSNHNLQQPLSPSLLGYFTHSINITGDEHEESMLLGGFHIKNLSPNTIDDLYICLRVDTENHYNFSGKFRNNQSSTKQRGMPISWERFDNSDDKKELWFRLIEGKQLEPYETVTFSDLQIRWENDEPFSCAILGFVYSELETEGVTSLNSINLNVK